MREAPLVVAVDVGGSGLRLQLSYAARPGPVLTAPGARVGSDGIDMTGLVESARSLIGGADLTDAVVVWSMRGLLFLADRAAVLDAVATRVGGRQTVVVSDAVAGLVGALGGIRPGAVVAAGTGAVAFGSDFASHWNLVDGWGHVLGDRGSAAWVGLEGLRAALRAVDGFEDGSRPLLDALRPVAGEPEGWPRLVMTSPDAPERLAAAAVAVTALADTDPVAGRICARAGNALAQTLLQAAAGLETAGGPGAVLSATGGLLAADPVVRALDAGLAAANRVRVPAQGTPLDGATALGRQLLDHGSLPTHPRFLLRRG